MAELGEGLKYPWGKPVRLLNILWILIPILGWFALYGYIVQIVNSVVGGNKIEYPEFNLLENFKLGFIIFIKYIPLMIALGIVSWILGKIPFIGALAYAFIVIFIVPYLVINLFIKKTVASSFELNKVFDVVFKNLGEYLIAFIYMILYTVIYGILSIVLVGIPCLLGSQIYIADFYAKHR